MTVVLVAGSRETTYHTSVADLESVEHGHPVLAQTGPTTAPGVLRALGEPSAVSSSLPDDAPSRAPELFDRRLTASGAHSGALALTDRQGIGVDARREQSVDVYEQVTGGDDGS